METAILTSFSDSMKLVNSGSLFILPLCPIVNDNYLDMGFNWTLHTYMYMWRLFGGSGFWVRVVEIPAWHVPAGWIIVGTTAHVTRCLPDLFRFQKQFRVPSVLHVPTYVVFVNIGQYSRIKIRLWIKMLKGQFVDHENVYSELYDKDLTCKLIHCKTAGHYHQLRC